MVGMRPHAPRPGGPHHRPGRRSARRSRLVAPHDVRCDDRVPSTGSADAAMAGRTEPAHAARMPTTSAPPVHRIADRLPLPPPGAALAGHAERADHYPVHVTRSRAALLERLRRADRRRRLRRGDRRERRGALRRRAVGALRGARRRRARARRCPRASAARASSRRSAAVALARGEPARPARRARRLRRRGGLRPGGLGGERLHARHPASQRAHDAARHGRRGARRQGGRRPPRGEEPPRRLLPAARGAHRRVLPALARRPPAPRRARRVRQEGDDRLARVLGSDRGPGAGACSRAISTRWRSSSGARRRSRRRSSPATRTRTTSGGRSTSGTRSGTRSRP